MNNLNLVQNRKSTSSGSIRWSIPRVLWLFACCAVLFSTSCLHQPTDSGEGSSSNYAYRISIPALNEDSVHITFTANRGSSFLLPFHYFDNPIDLCDGPTVRDLTITDAQGEQVTYGIDSIAGIPVTKYRLLLSGNIEYPVTIEYHPDLSVVHTDSTRLPLPKVHINTKSLFLLGAHLFILPDNGSTLTDHWRSPCPVAVHINVADALPLYGVPGRSFTCNTLYELLFVQLSAGQPTLATGHGGGIDFVFIDHFGTSWPAATTDPLVQLFSRVLDTIARSFGAFEGAPYTVAFLPTGGGLEGTYSFMAGIPSDYIGSSFAEVLAHEALHHFIGVRCGDYNDPWWKESATAYLGLQTMIRLQFYHPDYLRKRMTTPFLYADTARFQHALSDPWLRENMFTNLVHGIVYERGAQVMMLLDVAIRLGSENRQSLLSVTAQLCTIFEGSAFHRSDFITALRRTGMDGVEDFFARYVDDPYTVPDSLTLDRAFLKLDSLAGYTAALATPK